MLLKITILLSVVFQVIAALMAIRLIKKTKYNLAWMLITIGLAALLVRRVVEFLPLVSDFQPQDFRLLFIWVGTISSLFFAMGVILIRQIFNYIYRVESERRHTESRMLSSVIAAEESERIRLSRELHDGLGPLMSSIKMTVSAIEQQAENDNQKQLAANVNVLVQEALKSVKDISANLSPQMLNHFGLEQALSNFINKVNDSKQLQINFKMRAKHKRLPGNVEIIVYRVACELITNTFRHADAKSAGLEIVAENTHLILNYCDDGLGFDVDEVLVKQHGMGVANIYSRVSSLHGSVDILSNPGDGMNVKIYIPLKHEHTR
jgi:signal transduction histidine kinase